MQIIKRNGQSEEFEVTKIKKVIANATLGLKVNPLKLESTAILNLHEGIKTRDIQQTLINTAINLTSVKEEADYDWRFVASRLALYDYMKEVSITRKYKTHGYKSYLKFLEEAIQLGVYSDYLLKIYTKDQIQEMEKEINVNYDADFDYAGMVLLTKRYLAKYNGKPFELPQEMFLTLSLYIASIEKPENRIPFAKKLYHALGSRKISLATPILTNLRKTSGSLSSCFIISCNDSLDSIMFTIEQASQISKNGGGVGINLSRIRSQGASIQGVPGVSGGVIPWIRLLNDTAISVNQLGQRAGAFTVALDVWHRDIEDFLDLQTENGDQRRKAFDIFPQVVVPDLFFERVRNNQEWTLIDPHEIRQKYDIEIAELWGKDFEKFYSVIENDSELKLNRKVKAKDVFKLFLKTVVETGMPYMWFKDRVNESNPNNHVGMIGNGNLCQESWSVFSPTKNFQKRLENNKIVWEMESGFSHVCNLVSLNLATIKDNEELDYYTRLSVHILDNAIDLTVNPTQEAENHNKSFRIIGIGTMGLADKLAVNKLGYNNGGDFVDTMYEHIAYSGISESIKLAKERGVYKFYEGSDYSKSILFGKNKEWFNDENTKLGKDKWESLFNDLAQNGIRNGSLFAIAPNTSSAQLQGCTPSILPIFSKFTIEKSSKGSLPVIPPHLNKNTFWYYKENRHIDQREIIDIVSRIQKWVDQGISMELMLNLENGNVTAKDIAQLYYDALDKKLKSVYYVRSLSYKGNEDDCVSCAN